MAIADLILAFAVLWIGLGTVTFLCCNLSWKRRGIPSYQLKDGPAVPIFGILIWPIVLGIWYDDRGKGVAEPDKKGNYACSRCRAPMLPIATFCPKCGKRK